MRNSRLPESSLLGLALPKDSRIPVKGVIDVTHGSEIFTPTFGIKGRVYGVVGVNAQILAQMQVDGSQATDDHLGILQGKIAFVHIGNSKYDIHRNKSRFAKAEEKVTLSLKYIEWLGQFVDNNEEQI